MIFAAFGFVCESCNAHGFQICKNCRVATNKLSITYGLCKECRNEDD